MVVGTHRQFIADQLLQALPGKAGPDFELDRQVGRPTSCQWDIRPVFRNTTYQPWTALAGLRKLTRSRKSLATIERYVQRLRNPKPNRGNWLPTFSLPRGQNQIDSLVRGWQEDLGRFFQGPKLQPEDTVFFITMSDVEWLALAGYLNQAIETRACRWHVQFHFDLENESADRIESNKSTKASGELMTCRQLFEHADQLTATHRVELHTTSAPLARQYDLLGGKSFSSLTYPINPSLIRTTSSAVPNAAVVNTDGVSVGQQSYTGSENQKWNCTIAGGSRREKGTAGLEKVFQQIADAAIGSRVIIHAQGKAGCSRLAKRHDFVRAVRHPLPASEYAELIRRTDIGILLYDRTAYLNRRAGILGEYLACGIPVIVTSGCWLAEQLESPRQAYARELFENTPAAAETGDHRPGKDSALVAEIDWTDVAEIPRFFRLGLEPQQAKFLNGPGVAAGAHRLSSLLANADSSWAQTGRERTGASRKTYTMVEPEPALFGSEYVVGGSADQDTRVFDARTGNVVQRAAVRLKIVREQTPPMSAVGVSIDGPWQLLAALQEITTHMDHYRATARAFATQWIAAHDPNDTLASLTACDGIDYAGSAA